VDATRVAPLMANHDRPSTIATASDALVHDASPDGVDAPAGAMRDPLHEPRIEPRRGAEALLSPGAPGDHPSSQSYVLTLFRQELASTLRPEACMGSGVVTISLAEFIRRRMPRKVGAPIDHCEVRSAAMVCVAPSGEQEMYSVEIACRDSAVGHDCILLVEPEPHFVMETVMRGDVFREDTVKQCYVTVPLETPWRPSAGNARRSQPSGGRQRSGSSSRTAAAGCRCTRSRTSARYSSGLTACFSHEATSV